MRKVILISVLSLFTIAVVSLLLIRSDSGFKSEYFIPEDAVVIIETSDPIQTWKGIFSGHIWDYYKTNPYLRELNQNIQSYDSLLRSNKILWKVMGEKSLTISLHALGNSNYELLYIADVGKIAKSKNPEKLLKTVLGKAYEVTSRLYNDYKIIEVYDLEEKSNYFLCMAKGKAVFSFEPQMIEQSIDAIDQKIIGTDMKFIDVKSEITNSGLFQVYINYKQLANVANALSTETANKLEHTLRYMHYTGMSFDINEKDVITINSFSSLADTTPDTYLSMLYKSNSTLVSANVIPKRLASMFKVNFKNASQFIENTMESGGPESLKEYKETVNSIENKLKINLNNHLFNWMDKELVLLQTQPSNLGRSNEFALILNSIDSTEAAKGLNTIFHRIKKNTPVKIKTIYYNNYKIDYVAFPGIIQAFFGKTIKQLEKPYFTQIGKQVICSNHPQTLKNLIDDYIQGNTLATSNIYYNFSKYFGKKSSAEIYMEPPVLFSNLQSFVDATLWKKLKKNKKYISCFKQAGLQFYRQDKMVYLTFKSTFLPVQENVKKQYYNSTEIFNLFKEQIPQNNIQVKDTLPKIIIADLDARKHEEYYADGSIKLSVKLKDGLKNGLLKMYHTNGQLSLKGEYKNDKPVGKWRYYDENGALIKTDYYN